MLTKILIGSVVAVAGAMVVYPKVVGAGDASRNPSQPSAAEHQKEERFRSMMLKGGAALEASKFGEAKSAFEGALAIRPSLRAHLFLAKTHDESGNDKEALKEHAFLIDETPLGRSSSQSDPRVLVRYAELCLANGRAAGGRNALLRAASVPNLWQGRREDPESKGMWDDSDLSKKPILEIKSIAYEAAGNRDYAAGKDNEALLAFRVAAEANPKSWRARYFYGNLLGRLGAKRESAKELKQALALAPNGARVNESVERYHP